jgi:histone-lysine N-methyltransferase SETMAR
MVLTLKTVSKDKITKLGWTTLPHPPYSPDVAPSDHHLFGKLKGSLCETRFEDDDALITATNGGSDVLAYRP